MDAITLLLPSKRSKLGLIYIAFLIVSLWVVAFNTPYLFAIPLMVSSPFIAWRYYCALGCRGLYVPLWRFFYHYKRIKRFSICGLKYSDNNWYVLQAGQWLATEKPVIVSQLLGCIKVLKIPRRSVANKKDDWVFTLWRDEMTDAQWRLLHVYLLLV